MAGFISCQCVNRSGNVDASIEQPFAVFIDIRINQLIQEPANVPE